MAKDTVVALVAVLLSAAVSALVALSITGNPEEQVSTGGPKKGRPDRLEERVEDLSRRVDLLSSAPGMDPGLIARLEEVEQRLAAIGQPDAEGTVPAAVETREVVLLPASAADMTAEELAYQGRVMMGRRDYGTALAYWAAVLDGDPDEERRQEALYQTGLSYRMLKDHAKEEAAFRSWAAAQEPDSAGEMSALFQVSWSLYYQKKQGEALDVMERVARSANTYEATRPYALYHTANFAVSSGDYARARPYVVRLIEEYGKSGTQAYTWVLTQAKALLKTIDGG